jgi:hypothetical protein
MKNNKPEIQAVPSSGSSFKPAVAELILAVEIQMYIEAI